MKGGQKGKPRRGIKIRYTSPRMFDSPYLCTVGASNGGWIRYQLLPAAFGNGHHVNVVKRKVVVNRRDNIIMDMFDGYYHCVGCGLMGTEETFQRYHCLG